MIEPPTFVQVATHPGGTSAGASGVVASATTAAAINGQIRRIIADGLAIGLVISFPLSAGR